MKATKKDRRKIMKRANEIAREICGTEEKVCDYRGYALATAWQEYRAFRAFSKPSLVAKAMDALAGVVAMDTTKALFVTVVGAVLIGAVPGAMTLHLAGLYFFATRLGQ